MSRLLDKGRAMLAERGFLIFGVAMCRDLPGALAAALPIREAGKPPWESLVVVAHGGRRMWEAIEEEKAVGRMAADEPHPVDTFTARASREFVRLHLSDVETRPIFPRQPDAPHFPIQGLGEWLGWVHPSPLGIGISATYGLWHAYRFALVTTAALEPTPRLEAASPCDSCESKPCIRACPPGAVKESRHRMATFDVRTCAEFRSRDDSPCAEICLARFACPVGREHRYVPSKMRHVYGRSRITMRSRLEAGVYGTK
jgi:hypothetical protein